MRIYTFHLFLKMYRINKEWSKWEKKTLAAVIAALMMFSAQPALADIESDRSDSWSFGPKTFDLQAHRGEWGLLSSRLLHRSPMH